MSNARLLITEFMAVLISDFSMCSNLSIIGRSINIEFLCYSTNHRDIAGRTKGLEARSLATLTFVEGLACQLISKVGIMIDRSPYFTEL